MNKLSGFLVCFLVSGSLIAQMVNIESRRMQTDEVRFVFKSDFLFNYSNNDGTYIYRFDLSVATQYKTKDLKNTFFAIGNYGLIRSDDQDFSNSWFVHLRYNKKLSEMLRLEGFIQNQNNELLSINSRNLIGAGLRLKFSDKKILMGYFGNSYMYETEVSDIADQINYNQRNSSYLTLNLRLPESKLELINTVYFQPLYTDISNFRILEQFMAQMPLIGNLKVSSLFNYYYNNINPLGVSEFSSVISIGLTFEFEQKPASQMSMLRSIF